MLRTRLSTQFLLALLIATGASTPLRASGVPFQTGDVLAGVGNGVIKHFNSTGTLLDTLFASGTGGYDTGMAFDSSGNLYATAFNAQAVYKFDNMGNFLGAFGVFGTSNNLPDQYNLPESIVFDNAGNAYVGEAGFLSATLLKFSGDGLSAAYSPTRGYRGTDWVDLAADQCTLRYTSESAYIAQFNVCTNTQLPAFATRLFETSGALATCYAHRIRPNFEELVACTDVIYRIDSSGTAIQGYSVPESSPTLFALNLDPDNKTFWTADLFTGNVFRIDIASGSIITQFNAGLSPGAPYSELAGLTVVGEITAATTTAPPATTSYYVRTKDSKTLHDQGVLLAQNQISTGSAQTVALLFGRPTYNPVSQAYGASLWGHQSTVDEIASLAQDFIDGYYNALGTNRTLHVRLILATSNYSNNVTTSHGQAWAQMVNSVASWVITQGYAGQVDIAAGNNIELEFNTFSGTSNWVSGYSSVLPNRFMYDLGNSDGCPPSVSGCVNGWTQDNLWFVSWGAVPSLPLPEIYNKFDARRWQNLSLYGALNHNQSLIISGALTQQGACAQNPTDPTCQPAAFTPAQGWQSLYNALNGDARTAQTLAWSTDIQWLDTEQ